MLPVLQQVMHSLQEGQVLIKEQWKLNHIVNYSEHGWGIITKYSADDLADNIDDEKRIKKAERIAESKATKQHE